MQPLAMVFLHLHHQQGYNLMRSFIIILLTKAENVKVQKITIFS
jgi:hypothetical protein